MANIFKRLRRNRGWSIYEVMMRCESVKDQSIRNLENGHTIPSRVSAQTASELIEVFWPDLEFRHFVPGTPLDAKPRDQRARRRLLRHK